MQFHSHIYLHDFILNANKVILIVYDSGTIKMPLRESFRFHGFFKLKT